MEITATTPPSGTQTEAEIHSQVERPANCRWINVFNFYELGLGANCVLAFIYDAYTQRI